MNIAMEKVNIHTHHPTGRGIELRTAGCHPWDAEKIDSAALSTAGSLHIDSHTQAIGEIGLDFACDVDRAAQERLFCRQLELAQSLALPVVIHCVRAFSPVMQILARYTLAGVIFHSFIGSVELMRRAVQRGYYLSFGERSLSSPRTLEALRQAPLQNLFLETDDSDVDIDDIYRRAASLLGVSDEALSRQMVENYKRIFEK